MKKILFLLLIFIFCYGCKKDKKIWLFTIALFLAIGLTQAGQGSERIKIGTVYSSYDLKLNYFFIIDGVPIFKLKESRRILLKLDTTLIDSIILHKGIVNKCSEKTRYSAFLEVRTKNSINIGLKYILDETDSWILGNPMAALMINGKKKRWISVFKHYLSSLTPASIEKISIIEPLIGENKCKHGMIKLTINK
jgi:hypothetical protein